MMTVRQRRKRESNATMKSERLIHNLLEDRVARYGNREFLFFHDNVFGFEDFDAEANRLAAGLQARDIGKGDKIALMMANRPEYLFIWFGACKLGVVLVPVNPALKGEFLKHALDLADCQMIFVEEQFLDHLIPVLPSLPKLRKLVVMDPLESQSTAEAARRPIEQYATVVDNPGSFEAPTLMASDPYAILFTSGTSGPSKGVLMPHNIALANGEIFCRVIGFTESDRFYCPLPLFHALAQYTCTMAAMTSGASIVLVERFSASRFWSDVRNHGCTVFPYTGGLVPMLFKAEPGPDDTDNPLRVMVGGGTPRDMLRAFEKRFDVRLMDEGFGMTEIGMPMIGGLEERKPGSCGKVNPDYEVRVVDDQGQEVGPDTPGELWVRPRDTNMMMLEYYNMPEETVAAWRDLWFHTGDYVRYDENGYFNYVDRKKDALRRRGENISSFEVERGINSHPAVLRSAAVAAESELADNEVLACVVLKPSHELAASELFAYCEEHMPDFMVPRYIRFMEALPMTATARVQKHKLRAGGITADTWDRMTCGTRTKTG
jgi:crotonobetaine/carnitine-CoA ligase